MPKIKRAIISCHDKTGVVELAKLLRELDIEIVSTAGTLHELQKAGISAVNIADFTGVREMLDGRVKSLHSKVHAGLLGIRDNKLHCEQLQEMEYEWIDLVIVNLHPVDLLIERPGISPEEVIDQIDIGGATMLRSAAKNYRYVAVVVNPERYPDVMHELRALEGEVTYQTRFNLAQEAFACTARYDSIIANYFDQIEATQLREG